MVKNQSKNKKSTGFTLVETIIVIAIISILSTMILVSLFGARGKARDAKRKIEIAQIGRFLTSSCYLPDNGEGEYDLVPLSGEIFSKYPEYKKYISTIPRDPKTGSETESKYIYVVNQDGSKCALYANLENEREKITLSISLPTPGGGTGVFQGSITGWNGTFIYYQFSD